MLNVLPLPMVDGGRLVFIFIEFLRRGKRIAPEKEALVHLVGFAAMLLFAVVITLLRHRRASSTERACCNDEPSTQVQARLRRRRPGRRRRADRRAVDVRDRHRERRRHGRASSTSSRKPAATSSASPCPTRPRPTRCRRSSRRTPLPIIADIHFDYRWALAAIRAGFHGLRLNPGNIRDAEKVKTVAQEAKERGIPIRIGVNAGSPAADPRARRRRAAAVAARPHGRGGALGDQGPQRSWTSTTSRSR